MTQPISASYCVLVERAFKPATSAFVPTFFILRCALPRMATHLDAHVGLNSKRRLDSASLVAATAQLCCALQTLGNPSQISFDSRDSYNAERQ
jgi:hypothetical protein